MRGSLPHLILLCLLLHYFNFVSVAFFLTIFSKKAGYRCKIVRDKIGKLRPESGNFLEYAVLKCNQCLFFSTLNNRLIRMHLSEMLHVMVNTLLSQ